MTTTVFIATSVDGYIARTDGSLDWLSYGADPDSKEDYGYGDLMESVDCLVMGRNTYDTVAGFDPWPYGETRVIVLSSRAVEIRPELSSKVESMSDSPKEVVRLQSERGAKHLYIDGGKTIQNFLNDGLIQQLIITRIPILLGSGIPLFGPVSRDIRLQPIRTQQYNNGMVQTHYEVDNSRT